MSSPVHASGADGGDRHQQHLDAVRSAGPVGVAERLGDEHYLLADLVLTPGSMFDAERYEPGEFVQLLDRIHEISSVLEALRARTEVALADSYIVRRRAEAMAQAAHEAEAAPSQDKIDRVAEKTAGREISMITRRSPSSAGQSLASSRRLVEGMPEMLTALATGKITTETAYDSARNTAVLEPLARRQVDELLGARLPDMDGAGRGRWKQAITAAIESVDPRGETRRHHRARRERNVTVRNGEHGMATLTARMPAVDVVLMRKRLSLEAERLRAQGDRRGHQAIMADLLADTVLGREGEMDPVTLDVGLIITDRALFNPTHGDVAHIEGYGPVPAEAVREQLRAALQEPSDPDQDPYGPDGPALRAVLRRLYAHPRMGELVAVESEARAFPKELGRFLTIRDSTCRGPFCDAPIRQHDHIIPHSQGGPTSIENGQDACAHCNQKEEQLRTVRRTDQPGHRVEWVSHAGTRRVTAPPPLTAPETPRASRSNRVESKAPSPPTSDPQSSVPQGSEPPAREARSPDRPQQHQGPEPQTPAPEEATQDRTKQARGPKEQTRGAKQQHAEPADQDPRPTRRMTEGNATASKNARGPSSPAKRSSEVTDRRALPTKAPEMPRRHPGQGGGIPRREQSASDSGDSDAAAS